MAKGEKISLLIMRDNGEARRLRLRRSLFTVILVFFGIMPFVAGLSMWFGVDFWLKYRDAEQKMQAMDQEFHEAKATATRLKNLETLLSERDSSQTAQVMQNVQRDNKPANTSPEIGPPSAGEATEGPGHGDFPAINTGHVSVENVSIRLLAGNKIRISLDLTNPDTKKTISGKVACNLTTADGETFALDITPTTAAEFRITRLKRAVLVSTLPAGVNATNAQMVIEVKSDGGELEYRNVFPVAR